MHTTKLKGAASGASGADEVMVSAKQVVETVPMIMRLIRAGVRKGGTISLPQVRVLSFVSRNPGAGVSDVAVAMDVTTPTASALVDRLVRKSLIDRKEDPDERRRTLLNLTESGEKQLVEARRQSQLLVAQMLEGKTPDELAKINEGLAILAEAARKNVS